MLPRLGLFASGVVLWLGSTPLALTGTWPLALSVPFNAIVSFVLFTVAHDAAHNAVSSNAGRGRCAGSRSTSGTWSSGLAAQREAYLAHDPALTDVRGRPLTAQEYRLLRAMPM